MIPPDPIVHHPFAYEFGFLQFTGVGLAVRGLTADARALEDRDRSDIARGFQDALIETLAEKVLRAARTHRRTRIVLGGGVACNRALVAAVADRTATVGASVYAPTPRLATDNAAMIARAGLFRFERGERSGLDLNAYASLPLPGLAA